MGMFFYVFFHSVFLSFSLFSFLSYLRGVNRKRDMRVRRRRCPRRWLAWVAAAWAAAVSVCAQDVGDEVLLQAYELDEVVIDGKILRTRRSLKDNPAFAIINEIVSHIDDYRPATNGTLSRERRDVTSVALAEPSKGILKYEIRHHPNIFNKYLSYDALMTDDDGVVYVSCHEKSYTELFDSLGNSIRPTAIYELDNRSGETALTLLETALSVQHAARGTEGMTAFTRRTGIDDFLSEEEIEGPLNHYIGNTDIFSGDICIIGERFPSPISHFGTLFYRFAMSDTVVIGGQPCLDIVFAPRDGRSFSFVGHIFVDPDGHFIRHISMSTPSRMKLNFVKGVTLIQSFNRSREGRIDLAHETLMCRFVANVLGLERLGGAALRRDVSYREYKGQQVDKSTNQEADAELSSNDYSLNTSHSTSNSYADLPPSRPYRLTKGLIDELRKRPGYRLFEGAAGMAYTHYFPSDPLKPNFWYGPVGSLLSWNNVEGVRIRPGVVTSAYLHPQLMMRGYVAWGTRDHRWKYMAELEYSFNKKEKYFSAHPRNYIRLHSDYDILPLGNRQPSNGWDDLVSSINHPYNYPYAFQRRQELAYANEYRFGLTWEAVVRHRTLSDPASTFQTEFFPTGGFSQSELELNLRYAPGEVYKLEVDDRLIVNKETPVFTLSHTMARKGFLGSAYNYQRTLFTFQQRVRFHGYGFMDNSVRAGRLWTPDVPVPLRLVPPTTPNTIGPNGLFTDIDPMEMATDRYISWSIKCRTKGIIFNHIPLIRNLGWREVFGARTLWLSDALLPSTPQVSDGQSGKTSWQPIPYVRLIVGISNIFDVLEVDYIYRLTHRDAFHSDSDGFQLKLKLRF